MGFAPLMGVCGCRGGEAIFDTKDAKVTKLTKKEEKPGCASRRWRSEMVGLAAEG
jgi:hypothetical protein